MDILIPLGTGSTWNNNELRFCLRGVEKHLKGYGNIFIIGEFPDWLTNIIHIPATDSKESKFRERNIFNKIMLACNDNRVSEDFLWISDDHFLLKEVSAIDFPLHQTGDLLEHCKVLAPEQPYRRTIQNTINTLTLPVLNYDRHAPMLFNKERFKRSVGTLDWDKPFGYCIKTAYCNLNGLEGSYHPDYKLRNKYQLTYEEIKAIVFDRPYFSTDKKVHEGAKQILKELFPVKSNYEQ